jgi:cellulose synthase/poly-beta-1,6-N-acetylglucosamine synthase-like glycosyltransferase
MTRTTKVALTALLAVAWLVSLAGLVCLWMLMPLGGLVWAAGMGLVGYATVDVVSMVWGLDGETV